MKMSRRIFSSKTFLDIDVNPNGESNQHALFSNGYYSIK